MAKKKHKKKTQRAPQPVTKKNSILPFILGAAACVVLAVVLIIIHFFPKEDNTKLDDRYDYYAEISIQDYGKITVKLDPETAPITVKNFVNLAEDGFYDGLKFHRIIKNFMMQGGASSTPPENIYGEFSENGWENNILHTRGVISMARSNDPNSANSQFFIIHQDSPHLDGKYAAFGIVTEGIEVVDAICEDAKPLNNNGAIKEDERPVIESINIRKELK